MKHRNNLSKARTDAGLTQQEAAVKAGITVRYYQVLEAGDSLPGLKIAKAVAAALGKSVDDLWEIGRR
jgi:DNA-binding XRE family transcriptional regulator